MSVKESIEELLRSTGRKGMENLLQWMADNWFYTSPCSGGHHLSKEGGLAEHSLNVYNAMMESSNQMIKTGEISEDFIYSIVISSLLHDLGKAGDHGKAGYVPNMLKGRATKSNPAPEPYQSLKKPFKINDELINIDHEVRSVKIASQFIPLTEEEEQAILWHNGLYGSFRYQIQGKETPLYLLLHFADMWTSRVVEKELEVEEDE